MRLRGFVKTELMGVVAAGSDVSLGKSSKAR